MVPGDGIGKEVIPQAVSVIQATGAPVEFTEFDWGADRYLKDGITIPADGFQMLARDFDAIFVGALGDPRVPTNIHAKEILLGMRFKMDLYANVRPVKLLDESLCPLKNAKPEDVDFVVIRENTEGVYMDMGGLFKAGTPDEVATQEDINTRKGVERVIRFAFEYAKTNGRKKVLMSDKSNVMTYAGGLWQRVFKEVAKEYPEIQTQHMFVDALCLQMVREPKSLDVIVTNNMFGDIVTDLAAALQGGLGMAASGNIHPGRTSMFEPVHGSAPPIAGKNVANPMGAILTGAMMLAHLGFAAEAAKIEGAVLEAVRQKKTTVDVGGALGTRECAEWIQGSSGSGMTKKADQALGMDEGITRRDFLNSTLIASGAALLSSAAPGELLGQTKDNDWNGYGGVGDYANSNGNTQAIVNAGHEIRDKVYKGLPADTVETGEIYDCVIVGGGISGLAAALLLQQQTAGKMKSLVLENHAIFGGEARRNEFEVDGQRLAAHQGSAMFWTPFPYSFIGRFYDSIGLKPPELKYQTWEGSDPEFALPLSPYDIADRKRYGFYFPAKAGRSRELG